MLESLQRKQVLCVTREINNQADRVALPPHSLKSKQLLLPPLHPLGTGNREVYKLSLGGTDREVQFWNCNVNSQVTAMPLQLC